MGCENTNFKYTNNKYVVVRSFGLACLLIHHSVLGHLGANNILFLILRSIGRSKDIQYIQIPHWGFSPSDVYKLVVFLLSFFALNSADAEISPVHGHAIFIWEEVFIRYRWHTTKHARWRRKYFKWNLAYIKFSEIARLKSLQQLVFILMNTYRQIQTNSGKSVNVEKLNRSYASGHFNSKQCISCISYEFYLVLCLSELSSWSE